MAVTISYDGSMEFTRYYDQQWLSQASYFEVHRLRFLQTWDFVQRLPLPDTGRVLDVGGIGPIAAYLSEFKGWACAETRCDLRYPLSATSLSPGPPPPDQFDLVLCTETIEHIKDRESSDIADLEGFNYSGIRSLLQELRRVARPLGSVVISTPNSNSYITLQKWLSGELLLMDPAHVREFSMKDLLRVVAESALHLQNAVTIDSWDHQFGDSVKKLRSRLGGLDRDVERGDNLLVAACKAEPSMTLR